MGKITIGGSMGFKKIGKPYENIEAITYFSIEEENSNNFSEEEITKLHEKVNKILAEEAVKKMILAYKTYKEKLNSLEKLLDEGKL